MIESRPAIANAEWIVTIQLEVDDEPIGAPMTLRYADSFVAGGKTKTSQPDDFGYVISRALWERAQQLRPTKKRRKKK